MYLIFLLRLFFIIVFVSIDTQIYSAYNTKINFSLILEDDDVDMSASLMMQFKNGCNIGYNMEVIPEAGLKLQYKNEKFLCDVFGKIVFNHYDQIINNDSSVTRKLYEIRHQLKTDLYYSLDSSELSLKILPSYNPKNSSFDNDRSLYGDLFFYAKNIFLHNFLVHHYRRDVQGNWSFVGYETKDGHRSLNDFQKNMTGGGLRDLFNFENIENKGSNAPINENIENKGSNTPIDQDIKVESPKSAPINENIKEAEGDLKNLFNDENIKNKDSNTPIDQDIKVESPKSASINENIKEEYSVKFNGKRDKLLQRFKKSIAVATAHYINENDNIKYFCMNLLKALFSDDPIE